MQISRRFLTVLAAASLTAALGVGGIASAVTTTTGTWYFHGPQTYTDVTGTSVTGTSYESAVRAPINADKSSNFSAKRGVIPVQFDLLAASTTTTSTTRTYDPPVWKSIGSEQSLTYAGLNLSPTLTLNDITNLSATYAFTEGDCWGGSLRWTLYDANVTDGLINVYYGDPRNLAETGNQSCSGSYSETGKNLMDPSDSTLPTYRFELGNSGVYVDWATILAATNQGADAITGAQLTLDSGWKGDQRADVSDVTVNDNTWVPKTVETLNPVTVTGDYAKTCELPAAELRWAKNDGTVSGGVIEASSIQPKDTGQFYRQVDCKYIYNLDVSSLSGSGTYTVWVRIDGANIQAPATFDLR